MRKRASNKKIQSSHTFLVLIIVVMVLVIAITSIISANIFGSVNKAIEVLQALTSGDLFKNNATTNRTSSIRKMMK